MTNPSALALLLASVFALSSPAWAGVSWEVVGPCGPGPVRSGKLEADLGKSVGALTVEAFTEARIPFEGTEVGIASLLGVGNHTEIIDDDRARFYGWCYSVNGVTPELMANEIFLKSPSDRIVWFYAFTLYDSGNWIGQCTPASEAPPVELCRK